MSEPSNLLVNLGWMSINANGNLAVGAAVLIIVVLVFSLRRRS